MSAIESILNLLHFGPLVSSRRFHEIEAQRRDRRSGRDDVLNGGSDTAPLDLTRLRTIVAGVQVWAYPLVFAQRLRLNFTQPLDPYGVRPLTVAGAPANRFGHARK